MIKIDNRYTNAKEIECMKKTQLHSKLEKVRLSRKLSQKELSNKSGVSLRVIQSYEQNAININNAKISTLVDLCLILNCRLIDILDDELLINKFCRLLEINDTNNLNECANYTSDHNKELFEFFFNNENMIELSDDQKNGIKYVLLDFPKNWIEILVLRYRKQLSLRQIGEIHGITAERVRQIIHKALNKLEILKESQYVIYGLQSWHKKSIVEEVNRDIYEIPIEEMHLSGRAYNCLMRANLTTIGKVKELKYEDLLNMKNMGQNAANEVINKLKKYQ